MKVAICLPYGGQEFRRHHRCLAALMHAHPDWTVHELGGASVPMVRALIAESALEHDVDVTLWIDADMTFTTEACESIVADATRLDAVVGCLYTSKKMEGEIQAAPLEIGDEPLMEVYGVGFGLVAVPAKIFEKIELPRLDTGHGSARPWFSTEIVENGKFHTSDYAFCARARDKGFRVFADKRWQVGHLGEYEFTLKDIGS